MVKHSFNTTSLIFLLGLLIILLSGQYAISKLSQHKKIAVTFSPTPKPLGPPTPCERDTIENQLKNTPTKTQSYFNLVKEVHAHAGEGYDLWGIEVNVENGYPCTYVIDFKAEPPYENWGYTNTVHAYAFPDRVVRFQPPSEEATSTVTIYAVTPQGKTNKVIIDSQEFWEVIHTFPAEQKLGEITLTVGSEETLTLQLNRETKRFE